MWKIYSDTLARAVPAALERFDRAIKLALVLFVAFGPLMLLNMTATADQISNRSLNILSAQASATTTYTFKFTPAQTNQIQSVMLQACTTPLGSCTAPSGLNLSGGTVSQSGFQGATNFTKDTSTSGCTTVGVLCVTRSNTTAQTLVAHTLTDTGAVNQDGTNCSAAANCTFFVRITTFSDAAYTTKIDSGTVASSTTQAFTVNAAIQEVLSFCIGATTIDDADTTTPPLCSAISGTALALGVLDSAHVNVSPVSALNQGDGNNAIAELSTNAVNGTAISYDAIQQSGTNHRGTLRVVGAVCNIGNVNTDQCINAIGTTRSTITAATEAFGMTIAGVNCKNTLGYSCSYAGNTYNLRKAANYDGTGVATTYLADAGQVSGTTSGGYAWDESGTSQTIASASTVVDNEALIIKFAATPTIVTPTGSYTAQADYVATPTY
ncbi:MAG TPA: hypothetical protein VH234_02690 [Candidatus Saccharimonadales bacterium]|jgi:hypothetical protein|nr:hypothetical protein [Candidatus Saccharimonadales bacterium]